jgi:hypothetical protein
MESDDASLSSDSQASASSQDGDDEEDDEDEDDEDDEVDSAQESQSLLGGEHTEMTVAEDEGGSAVEADKPEVVVVDYNGQEQAGDTADEFFHEFGNDEESGRQSSYGDDRNSEVSQGARGLITSRVPSIDDLLGLFIFTLS